MLQMSRGRGPLVFLCCLFLGVSACTFPAIDYVDADESEGGACAATPKCVSDIDTCSKQAEGQRFMCMSQCQKTGPMNLNPDCSTCDSAHETDLLVCVAQCEACSANTGCANATESCRSLLGLP
ncbi:hypothetical protein [Polyangium sp. 6x1]|uniref:hypothetical protein n=1 Tax=Polyangium sp. 6x1 TaxID=3042689 RepID=UPI0024830AE4|nr:hypothetical protein [Polyangium sp. 6x1]MDI1448784.1 hypothetical protein [Polyangium sp. 6x1]